MAGLIKKKEKRKNVLFDKNLFFLKKYFFIICYIKYNKILVNYIVPYLFEKCYKFYLYWINCASM